MRLLLLLLLFPPTDFCRRGELMVAPTIREKGGKKRKRIANRILTALGVRVGGKSRRTMSRGGGLEVAFSLLLDQDPKTTLFAAGRGEKGRKKRAVYFFSPSLRPFLSSPLSKGLPPPPLWSSKKKRSERPIPIFCSGSGKEEGRFPCCRYTSYSGGEQKHDSNLQSVVQTLQDFFFSVCAKGQCLSISPKNPSSCRSFQIDCLTSPTSSSWCTGSGRRVSPKIKKEFSFD